MGKDPINQWYPGGRKTQPGCAGDTPAGPLCFQTFLPYVPPVEPFPAIIRPTRQDPISLSTYSRKVSGIFKARSD
jgi:hypothetical protein